MSGTARAAAYSRAPGTAIRICVLTDIHLLSNVTPNSASLPRAGQPIFRTTAHGARRTSVRLAELLVAAE